MSNVRRYDGVNDETRLGTTLALTGAFTIAVVMKLMGGDGAWQAPMVSYAADQTSFRAYIERDTTNKLRLGNTSGATNPATPTFLAADGWFLFIATKGAGTVAPVFYWRKEADSALSTEASATTLPDGLTINGGHLRVGDFGGSDWLNALIARMAFWDGVALNATQAGALVGGTLNAWKTGAPAPSRLYEFDQANPATAIVEQMGTADAQASQVETTVNTTDAPPSSLIVMTGSGTPVAAVDSGAVTDASAGIVFTGARDSTSIRRIG